MVIHLFTINNTVTYTIDLYNTCKACRTYAIQEWLTGGGVLNTFMYRERETRDKNRTLIRSMIIYMHYPRQINKIRGEEAEKKYNLVLCKIIWTFQTEGPNGKCNLTTEHSNFVISHDYVVYFKV